MDNKNVFVAIALSMSVLLFWGAFFETPRKNVEQKTNQKLEKKIEQDSLSPTINQTQFKKKLTREESLTKDKRIIIENNSIVGSLNLKGALIDDISFKKHYFLESLRNRKWFFYRNGMDKCRKQDQSSYKRFYLVCKRK